MEPYWNTAATLATETPFSPVFLVEGLVMLEHGLVLYLAVLHSSSVRLFQEFRMDTCQLQGKGITASTALLSMGVTVASGWLV